MSNDAIELEGTVTDILGGGKYKVRIEEMDLDVEAYAAGKMKKFNIKIIPGDLVKVELSPYEPTKGRIVYRSIQKPKSKKAKQEIVQLDDIVGNSDKDKKDTDDKDKK